MIGKIEAVLRKPFMQLWFLVVVIAGSIAAGENIVEFYRGGADWDLGAVVMHVAGIVLLTLTFRHLDYIEARLKVADNFLHRYAEWKASKELD